MWKQQNTNLFIRKIGEKFASRSSGVRLVFQSFVTPNSNNNFLTQ